MKSIAKAALLLGALAPAIVSAQDSSTKMMTGKPGSVYEKVGIHKIAAVVSDSIDMHFEDEMLLKNERVMMAAKQTPRPLIKFLVTTWVAHNQGGPQMIGLPGMPDAGQVAKSFMLSKGERARFEELIVKAHEKHGFSHADATKYASMCMGWIDKSKMPTEMAEKEMFKDPSSLYARLGGIAPLTMVVDDFVNLLGADPVIGSNPHTVKALTSGKVSVAGIKFLLAEQLAMAAGGPWKYTGRDMATSHKELMISEKEWEAGAGLLKKVLEKYMVPAKEQGEIFAAITGTKKDIVKGGGRR